MDDWKKTIAKNLSILEHYGVKSQIPIWIEEMSELTKELCKWLRKYDELTGDINLQLLANMKEEITDVTICLDQLKYAIGYFEDDLMKVYNLKVSRQLERMKNEVE